MEMWSIVMDLVAYSSEDGSDYWGGYWGGGGGEREYYDEDKYDYLIETE